jgi:phosphatidylinositol glycan class V
VGLFKYWTVSNIPLFLLAMPMLYLMLRSSFLAMTRRCQNSSEIQSKTKAEDEKLSAETAASLHRDDILIRLMLPQFVLALLALTTFHVQVITRLSSAYPLWYLVLAKDIVNGDGNSSRAPKWTVRYMIMYGLIQGVLFASFLPPA